MDNDRFEGDGVGGQTDAGQVEVGQSHWGVGGHSETKL